MQSINKRKREELESDAKITKKNVSSELRILKYEFKIIKKKYYVIKGGIKYLINEYIESNFIDTLTINFNLQDQNFFQTIPSRIKTVRLINTFNSPIDLLPDTITQLEVLCNFNQMINKLPNSLTHLILNCPLSYQIEHFPEGLVYLELPKSKINVDNLPEHLIHLKVGSTDSLEHLPEKITHLTIGDNCSVDNLPESVKYLTLENDFNLPVNNLPRNLIKLNLTGRFNQSVNNLPNDLVDLVLGYNFTLPIDNLPPNLRTLSLGQNFKCPINNLPNSLEYIYFDNSYPHSFENLPTSIKIIELNVRSFGWFCNLDNYLDQNGQLFNITPTFTNISDFQLKPFNYHPNLEKIILNNVNSQNVQLRIKIDDSIHIFNAIPESNSTCTIKSNGKKIMVTSNFGSNSLTRKFVLSFRIVR